MAIELPRASPSSATTGGRRRAVRLPTAGSVPQIQVARDPGVRVPTPDSSGIAAVGRGIEGLSQELQRTQRRQEREHDATQTAEAQLRFDDRAMAEFRRRQGEDDPTRPAFMEDFAQFLGGEANAETGLRGDSGLVKEILDSIPAGVSQEAKDRLKIRLQRSTMGLTDAAGRLSLQESRARADDAISTLLNRWSAQAERDPDFLDALLAEADESLAEFSGTLKDADLERDQKTRVRLQIIRSGLVGMADEGRPDQAEIILDSGKYDDDLSPAARGNIRNAIEAERREQERELAIQERKTISRANDIAVVLETGRQAAGVEEVKAQLDELGTERSLEARLALDQAEQNGAALNAFVTSPLADQRATIRELQTKEEISRDEMAMLGRLERAHTAVVKGLVSEPFETAIALDVIDEVAPVDFGDVSTLAARSDQATLIAGTYGVPIMPLSSSEIGALEATLDQATPLEAAAVLANLSEGFGEEGVEQIAGAFKQKRPHLAMAVFHGNDNLELSADIIDGARILRENPDIRPTPTEMEGPLVNVYGNLFEFMPELRAPFREAAAALYASRVIGSTDKGFQDDAFDLALREVAGAAVVNGDIIGGPFEVRGRTVLPPAPGQGEVEFDSGMENLTEADLVAFGNIADPDKRNIGPVDSQGRPISVDDIRLAQPVALGFGKYAFMFEGLGFVSRPDATPGQAVYVLDLGAFLEAGGEAARVDQPLGPPLAGPTSPDVLRARGRAEEAARQEAEFERLRERSR